MKFVWLFLLGWVGWGGTAALAQLTVTADIALAATYCTLPVTDPNTDCINVPTGNNALVYYPGTDGEILITYRLTNNTGGTITQALLTDSDRGTVIPVTAVTIVPGQTVTTSRVYPAETTPRTVMPTVTAAVENAAGSSLTATGTYDLEVVAPELTLAPELFLARDECTDPLDLLTCGTPASGPNTLTVGAGTPLYLQYRTTNSGLSTLQNFTWTADLDAYTNGTGASVGAGSTLVSRQLANAPATFGTQSFTATVSAEDAAGNTVTETANFTLDVQPPASTLQMELYLAGDACSNSTDLGTCTGFGGPTHLTVAAGDSLYLRYVTTNTGVGHLTNHAWGDTEYGQVTTTSYLMPPGNTLIAQRIETAPTTPGFYTITATHTAEDEAGNPLTTTATYTLDVQAPSSDLQMELYHAADACTNSADLSTCGAAGGPDQLVVAAGDSLYLRYVTTNTSIGAITTHVWDDSEYGQVTTTGYTMPPGATVIAQQVEVAPSLPGIHTITATHTAQDLVGNPLTTTDTYTLDVRGPTATATVELYKAVDICTDVTNLSSCSIGSGGTNTLTVGSGEVLYIEVPTTNDGIGTIGDHAWTDSELGLVSSTGFDSAPGVQLIARYLLTAPAAPGTYSRTVTYTGTDLVGNPTSVVVPFTITVDCAAGDFAGPEVLTQDVTYTLSAGQSITVAPAAVNNGSNDACGTIAGGTVAPNSFDCADVGTHTVTLTLFDQDNNSNTATATVTIQRDDLIASGQAGQCENSTTAVAMGQQWHALRINGELAAEVSIGGNFNITDVRMHLYRESALTQGSGTTAQLTKRIGLELLDNGTVVQPGAEPVRVRLYYRKAELDALGSLSGSPVTGFEVIKSDGIDCGAGFSATNATAMTTTLATTGCNAEDRYFEFFTGAFSTFYLFSSSAILPVTLADFAVQPTDVGAAQLTWITHNELNNSHFEIERSADGRAFELLGEVLGAGTTNEAQQYAFEDEQPLPGTSYYRLRQVDFDGTAHYSDVRSLRFPIAATTPLTVFPNPAYTTLSLAAPTEQPVQIRTLTGKAVGEWPAGTTQLAIAHLPAGVYLLASGTAVTRWVKQ